MSKEKDIFSESIKEHLNDFEVPFNEGHWAEMEQKLDQMPASDFAGKAASNTKYYIAAGVGAALIAGYFIIKPIESALEELPVIPEVEEKITVTPENNTNSALEVPVKIEEDDSEIKSEKSVEIEGTSSDNANEINVDDKADKYANYSEHQVKEEGKTFVEDKIEAQEADFVDAPKLDNLALKSEILINSKGPLCVDEPIEFAVKPEHENLKYYWNFGDNGLTSRKQEPSHKFKRAGTFEVTLIVSKGEKDTYMAKETVTIGEKPDVSISWVNKQITLNDPYIDMTVEGASNCKYTWLFNDDVKFVGSEASFLVPKNGYFPVEVTATSANGCTSKVSKGYSADKGVFIIVENSFTPGNGINNEEFLPKELKEADVEFSFIVRDMKGNQVFESHDKYKAWNGSLNNSGSILPEGPYLWVLTFQDDKGRSHKQDGKINLIK